MLISLSQIKVCVFFTLFHDSFVSSVFYVGIFDGVDIFLIYLK